MQNSFGRERDRGGRERMKELENIASQATPKTTSKLKVRNQPIFFLFLKKKIVQNLVLSLM